MDLTKDTWPLRAFCIVKWVCFFSLGSCSQVFMALPALLGSKESDSEQMGQLSCCFRCLVLTSDLRPQGAALPAQSSESDFLALNFWLWLTVIYNVLLARLLKNNRKSKMPQWNEARQWLSHVNMLGKKQSPSKTTVSVRVPWLSHSITQIPVMLYLQQMCFINYDGLWGTCLLVGFLLVLPSLLL